MRSVVFYVLSTLWGFVMTAAAFAGADQCINSYVECVGSDGTIGHPSPFLFFVPFIVIVLIGTIIFLVCAVLYLKIVLRGFKWRSFGAAILLYLFGAVGGWFLLVAFLVSGIE